MGTNSSLVLSSKVFDVTNKQVQCDIEIFLSTKLPTKNLYQRDNNFTESKQMYVVKANLQIFLLINFSRKALSPAQYLQQITVLTSPIQNSLARII
jgi:hypothetical protein